MMTLAGFSRQVWWFTILDFFRLQYACLAVFLLAVAFYTINIYVIILVPMIVGLNLYRIRLFLPNFQTGDIIQNKDVLSVNAYQKNHDPKALAKTISMANPQVLLIMEMTEKLENALHEKLAAYPYRLKSPVRDGFEIWLLSKTPLEDTRITKHCPSETPLLSARVNIRGKDYRVFSAHPKPALNKHWYMERQAYFDEVEKVVAQADLPVLMLGDFNAVPWEKRFTEFLHKTNLKSTLEGHGYKVTWPVYFPVMGIPMDHILITRNAEYNHLRTGPYVGSDHYPVSLKI